MQCDLGYEDVDALSKRTAAKSRAEPSLSLSLWVSLNSCTHIQTIPLSPRGEEKRIRSTFLPYTCLAQELMTRKAISEERVTLQSKIFTPSLLFFSCDMMSEYSIHDITWHDVT